MLIWSDERTGDRYLATDLNLELTATQARSVQGNSRLLWQGTAFMLVLFVLCAFAGFVDERTLRDVSVWSKPLKFQASLAMYLATLALLAPLIDVKARASLLYRSAIIAGVVAGLLEIAYITVQAARGRASHFNLETSLEATLYQLMGIAAVVLVAVSAAVGVWILRRPVANLNHALRLGAGWGMILGSILTLLIAGHMGGLTDHLVVPGVSDADGIPITGWSTTTGDLRVPHFFATHMMQALPLVAWVASRRFKARAMPITLVAGVVWIALTLGTLIQALAGQPLLG